MKTILGSWGYANEYEGGRVTVFLNSGNVITFEKYPGYERSVNETKRMVALEPDTLATPLRLGEYLESVSSSTTPPPPQHGANTKED